MADGLQDGGIVIGVGAMAIGRKRGGHLVTYALGSCVGVSAYDPITRVGGILHFMLPSRPAASAGTDSDPFLYATTGIPAMFDVLAAAGAQKQRLVVCAAGGAEILVDAGAFRIGQRNRDIVRKILAKAAIAIAAEDLGGKAARTMTLDLSTGVVKIRTGGTERVLWAAPNKTLLAPLGTKP